MQSKNKTRLTVVTLIVLTVTLFLMATDQVSQNNIFPYEMKQFQLENGLNVVAIPYDSPGILAYYTIVRTGSRNEVEPGKSGFAHFFEHVMFRGTEKYPADVYNKEMQLLGADFNASTDDDWTRYYQVLPSSGLEKIIDIESDRFQNLKYTEQAFKTEAGAILGEYNKSMSNPFLAMFERIQELAFTKHTYGHTTIGYLQDIKDMPNQYAYSLEFYDRWYRPENCTVLVVGDFDYDQLQKLIKQYYSGWKRRDYKQAIQSEPEQTSERRAAIKWKSPTFPILMTGYKTPGFSVQSKDYAALDILGSYVFGETSELYKELVLDKQWVEFINVLNMDRRDPNLFFIFSRIKDENNIARVEQAIDTSLEKAKNELMSDEKLKAIKSRLKYSFAMGLDNPDKVALTIGNYINLTGDPNAVNELYAKYDEVTAQDVQAVAKQYFDAKRRTVVTLTYQAK